MIGQVAAVGDGWRLVLSGSSSLLHFETTEDQAQGQPPHPFPLHCASHLCAQELEASAKSGCMHGMVPQRIMELAARHKLPCVLGRGPDGRAAVLHLRMCLPVCST